MTSTIPVVETERLILREHRLGDFEALHTVWTHPSVYEFITGKPSTRELSWGRLLKYAGLWALNGYGFWAVEEKATGRYIGDLGFANFLRDIEPPFGDTPEMGWVLAPDIHGKGYASEALAAAAAWGDGFFKQDYARCIISPENTASVRVAEKTGFKRIDEIQYTGEKVLLLERKFRH
ncbi:GNAT family N-acetyltransferase [Phyllobacterium meliloti]|uniref:GNAT family N-acetyltransferase n=1 Tax=Phyllobacterium meliloti TaxID=555317 RepID=UPI001D158B76|nr:GNAT family N-acetyltransferase [Phyllobacterium sp. T1293]UGX85548.1 GNAT family N-acetyltransferase [Phyllobacterium sp. T1293]